MIIPGRSDKLHDSLFVIFKHHSGYRGQVNIRRLVVWNKGWEVVEGENEIVVAKGVLEPSILANILSLVENDDNVKKASGKNFDEYNLPTIHIKKKLEEKGCKCLFRYDAPADCSGGASPWIDVASKDEYDHLLSIIQPFVTEILGAEHKYDFGLP
mmetsp:Transcript_21839/g.24380  ORF Transcript_21839/g.24380 Transcript_21839/m.24380 type:complete len:156 (+) Transcript_21839:2-469(+)